MYKIPESFSHFIELDCNRLEFIVRFLNKAGLEVAIIPIDDNCHLYVKFPMSHYDNSCRVKTVIAHYDRVPGTPGANDNSAAVFSMLNWAVRLNEMGEAGHCHNVRLIFSDGEEKGELGVTEQGAYSLARLFRKLKIINDDIFVFDCMGRGDIPILTETALPGGISADFAKSFYQLEQRAQCLLRNVCGDNWYSLPCNYSDNAGFIANGIPAVAITLLPANELADAIKGTQPKTWSLNHSMEDNINSVEQRAFEITARILDKLGEVKNLKV